MVGMLCRKDADCRSFDIRVLSNSGMPMGALVSSDKITHNATW